MTDHTIHENYEPTREDVLIGRVVDHEATPIDWAQLDELALVDAELWSRLGRAQRAHAGLRIAIEDAIAPAELVEIPSGHLHNAGRMTPMRRVLTGAGWATAAVLALVLLNPMLASKPSGTGSGTMLTAGMPRLLSQATADEAYTHYVASGLADGRVVSEMPAIVLEQNELPDGRGVEIYVVRRVVERRELPAIVNYAPRPDEYGIARLTPIEPRYATTPFPAATPPETTPPDAAPSDDGLSF